MSQAIVKLPPDIDPEFASAYHAVEAATPDRVTKAAKEPVAERDALLELKAIAEKQQREGIPRKSFADGSFDQVENDLANTFKIGWDFLTRT